jgi:hypothetical protein
MLSERVTSGKILEIAFSVVIPIVATFGGYAVGLQKGRDDMCLVARECEPGFSAKFVRPGCLCVPKAVRR